MTQQEHFDVNIILYSQCHIHLVILNKITVQCFQGDS